jgi:hypothetical protein
VSKSVETVSGFLLQRPGGAHGAVVEFDALADADRARPDHEHLLGRRGVCLVLLLVRRVEVGRRRIELGGAGVHHLVDRPQSPLVAQCAHLLGQPVGERADLRIAEAEALGLAQQAWRQVLGEQAPLHRHDAPEAFDEPGVDAAASGDLARVDVAADRGEHGPEAFVRSLEGWGVAPGGVFPEQRAAAELERADGLL